MSVYGNRRAIGDFWRGARLLCATTTLIFLAVLLPASALATLGDHVFDPTLSLTGGTVTSSLDPVPDPGEAHPPQPFSWTCNVAVDSAGDVYVANGAARRIDIFSPEGLYIGEVSDENEPCRLAVDAEGNLYVKNDVSPQGVVRYTPSSYPPTPLTAYEPPVPVAPEGVTGIAVDRSTGHLFVDNYKTDLVEEYGSAQEGNLLLKSGIGAKFAPHVEELAVDSSTKTLFVGGLCQGCPYGRDASHPHVSVVYVLDEEGNMKGVIDGSDLPTGGFEAPSGYLGTAVDEATGEVFVSDVFEAGKVYRFVPTSGGGYAYAADPELESHDYYGTDTLTVANGAGLVNEHDVYVPYDSSTGHVFAFTPEPATGPPVVSQAKVANLTTEEAGFAAEVNPNGFESEYRFEYVSDAVYLEDVEALGAGHGFDHALSTGTAILATGRQPVGVFAGVQALVPGTAYRVRAVASSHCDAKEPAKVCETVGTESRFETYPVGAVQQGCSNEALRVGFSSTLPDCRAYELVTPPETNGVGPDYGLNSGELAETPLVSPDGESVLFMILQGPLPWLSGVGTESGYEARREADGWQSYAGGPSGAQIQAPSSGGVSADHRYWLWSTVSAVDRGSLVVPGVQHAVYVRLPDGSFRLLGEGSLGSEPSAKSDWISHDGSHILFSSNKPLVEGASPEGVSTIYDRPFAGEARIVSLLPDGKAPGAGAAVTYAGASADGSVVAFTVDGSLYVRLGGERTIPVAESAGFAGLSDDGSRLTYVKSGDAYSFDIASATSTQIGSGGQTTIVNVSADGSHVYFVSTKRLTPAATGAGAGLENFYVWDAANQSVTFIAVLDPVDVTGEAVRFIGLGRWTVALERAAALDPSRTTPDGRAIVFESRASLAGYETDGHKEVYRYETGAQGGLQCVSCMPTLASPTSGADLQNVERTPSSENNPVSNLSADGKKVFFETREALVPSDDDGVQDVYEWEARGAGGCTQAQGCVSLISSGTSGTDNYLYAANPSGRDVFIDTTDVLTSQDGGDVKSIYDARVEGGFAPAQGPAAECLGEACQPTVAFPLDATPASVSFEGRGNAHEEAGKPRSRRAIKKAKNRCAARRVKHRGRRGCRRRRRADRKRRGKR